MKLSQPMLSIQQPRSPQGIQTPQVASPSSKSPIKINANGELVSPSAMMVKQRSCSINVQPEMMFTCVKPHKENQYKGKKKHSKQQKPKQIRDMSPKEITNLLKENQSLKDEILRMQNLIQEVVPVFSKITEELEEESIFKTHDEQRQVTRNHTQSSKGKHKQKKLEEITFLEQSLRQLKSYFDQKDHPYQPCRSREDSEFLDAENLDMTTLDERQTCGQRIKSSVLTFGYCNSIISDKNQSPKLNNQPVNYAMNYRPKLVDLNRQSKNFNMPKSINSSTQKKSQLIDFEEIDKVKNLLSKINNTDLLKELRNSQQFHAEKPSQDSKSRNQPEKITQATQHMSVNVSNDSGFSDDPSIPADSFEKQTVHFNIMPKMPSRSKSPFSKFQVTNMQQKYVESEKQLNKLPQKHEMNYPIQILAQAAKNFNSCASIESSESDTFTVSVNFNPNNHNPIQTIQSSVSNRIQDNFTPERKGISPMKRSQVTSNEPTPLLSPINSNFMVSPSRNERTDQYLSQPQVKSRPTLEDFKKALMTDNEKYAHYIREVNFDKQGNKDEISNDNIGVEYFFQSQSKDCFHFSHSIQSTDNVPISKRESVDHMLWMLMKNESPVKSQTQLKNPVVASNDTMKLIYNPEDEFTLVKRQSSGLKKQRTENKENAQISPQKSTQKSIFQAVQQFSDQRHLSSPCSEIVVSKVLEESFPVQQVLCIQQEQRPHLEVSSAGASSMKRSIAKSNSTSGPLSVINGAEIHRIARGKSLSLYNLADQVKQAITDADNQIQETEQSEGHRLYKRSPSFCKKWTTLEEKEKNLAELNQQIITRTRESLHPLVIQNDNFKEDMQPSNNLKITQKLCPKGSQDDSLCMIDNSSFITNQQVIQQVIHHKRDSSAGFESKTTRAQDQKVESPCIIRAPTVQQAKSLKQSPKKTREAFELAGIQVDNSPLITLMNTSKTESESGVSSKSQQRYQKFITQKKQERIFKELQVLDKELEQEDELERKQKTYLETPSPRVLDPVIQTPQFTIDQLRIINDEAVTFRLDNSEVQIAQSELLKKEKDKEILTSRRVSTADRREFETSSQKSVSYDPQHLVDLINQQHQINKLTLQHERINSCCQFQEPIQLLDKPADILRIPRGSEIEESPREPEFQMAKKPAFPVHKEIVDYAPRQTPIPEEGSSTHSSIVDIKISPTKDVKSIKETTVIQEEPSDEEQDISQPAVVVVAVDHTLINLASDENSKLSISQVEMMEGEMFSSKGLQMIQSQRESIVITKDICPSVKASEQTSNYNSSRYKTPLRQFLNSGLKSQQSSQQPLSNVGTNNNSKNHSSIRLNQQTMDSHNVEMIENLKVSMVKSPLVFSPMTEEKKTPQKKPFFIPKRDTHHKSGNRKDASASRIHEYAAKSENNSSRSHQKSQRDKMNKMRIDFTQDKSNIKKSFIKNEACQSIVSNNDNIVESARGSSRVRANYSSIIQKSTSNTPQRNLEKKQTPSIQPTLSPSTSDMNQFRIIPTTTQSQPIKQHNKMTDLEVKLKEKELRIKEIMNRKAQLDEQRQQIRQLKEEASQASKKNDQQKINLSKGLYLRKQSQETIVSHSTTNNTNINTYCNQQFSLGSISQTTIGNQQQATPTSSQHKIILKKESIMQSFCSNSQQKKVYIKPEKATGNSSIFCTIEAVSQTPNQLREPPVQSSISQLEAFLGPQTERVYPVNFKDTSSPISGLQPTLRQVEFFKKIEDDCFKRKIKHQSRLEHVSQVAKQRQKLVSNHNNA